MTDKCQLSFYSPYCTEIIPTISRLWEKSVGLIYVGLFKSIFTCKNKTKQKQNKKTSVVTILKIAGAVPTLSLHMRIGSILELKPAWKCEELCVLLLLINVFAFPTDCTVLPGFTPTRWGWETWTLKENADRARSNWGLTGQKQNCDDVFTAATWSGIITSVCWLTAERRRRANVFSLVYVCKIISWLDFHEPMMKLSGNNHRMYLYKLSDSCSQFLEPLKSSEKPWNHFYCWFKF